MSIIDRLKNNELIGDELLQCLDSSNPIVLYQSIIYIVNNHVTDKVITDKLFLLSELLNDDYKLLGYYKLGHAAMGALSMAAFNRNVNNCSKVDWSILIKGSISLYCDVNILIKDLEWLKNNQYKVIILNYNEIFSIQDNIHELSMSVK